MSERNDGGAAFPTSAYEGIGGEAIYQQGMTLRDWFAGQALMGMLQISIEAVKAGATSSEAFEPIGRDCYKCADRLLAERARDKP